MDWHVLVLTSAKLGMEAFLFVFVARTVAHAIKMVGGGR